MDLAAIGAGYDEATQPTTVALKAAKDQRVSLRRAISSLEDALAAPAAGRMVEWARRVTGALDHLAEVFELHVAVTERPGGLYEEILEIAPRLANRVKKFHREHVEITQGIQHALVGCRAVDGEDPAALDHLRDRITVLLGLLVRHRQRGADLVYEAYAVEIGGES